MKLIKDTLIIALILFSSTALYAQTEIDDVISANVPGEISIVDTSAEGREVYNVFGRNEDEIYMVQRIKMSFIYARSKKDLYGFYRQFIGGQEVSYNKMGLKLRKSKKIKIQEDFYGYQYDFESFFGNKAAEARVIYLSDYIYVITYFGLKNFNESNKDEFLNSLKINTSKSPKQLAN